MESFRPNVRRGLYAGAVAGAVAFVLCFALCWWSSTLPAVSDASLCWAFRPWWRLSNWVESLVVGAVIGVIAAFLAAFRPQTRK